MKKYLGVIITLIIFIPLIGGAGYFYYWIFSRTQLPEIIRILIVAGTLALLTAFVAAGIQRFKEIRQEDKNDLSKY